MPRGPVAAVRLCILSNARQGLSYLSMRLGTKPRGHVRCLLGVQLSGLVLMISVVQQLAVSHVMYRIWMLSTEYEEAVPSIRSGDPS